MISSPIDEIKSRLNIVDVIQGYIKLQKAGANFRAPCPFHSEKTPSFFVSPARQIWHCFGSCSEGGDMFKFVMKIEGVEFGDALRILAQKAGVELHYQDPGLKTERRRLFEICELSAQFFEKQLENSLVGKEVNQYLLGRGIKPESIKKWRLGYSPDTWRGLSDFIVSKGYKREEIIKAGLAVQSDKGGEPYDRFRGRIMFPVFNLSSQVIGFGGRVFREKPNPDGVKEAKYVNTPNTLLYDKSQVLYGLNFAGLEMRKKDACIIVEGYVDAIMVSQAGTLNVVASSGTALSNYQLKILKRYSENLLTAFDMDIAGDSATKRGIDLAMSSGFNVKVVTMAGDYDPADIVEKDPKIWDDAVASAKTIHDFYFQTTLAKFDKATMEGKKGISKTLLPIIKKIPSKIEQSMWVQSLAKVLAVKEEDVAEELQKTVISGFTPALAEAPADKEIAMPLGPRSRKELLEEHLAVLLIKFPKCLDLLCDDNCKEFSPKFAGLISHFKKNGLESRQGLSQETIDFSNYLALKSEVTDFGAEFNGPQEFECCLKEMATFDIKKRLDSISQEIKKAEEQKDSVKVQQLIQEFNLCSKSRNDLETA